MTSFEIFILKSCCLNERYALWTYPFKFKTELGGGRVKLSQELFSGLTNVSLKVLLLLQTLAMLQRFRLQYTFQINSCSPWQCCKDLDFYLYFKSINENRWHQHFVILEFSIKLFPSLNLVISVIHHLWNQN